MPKSLLKSLEELKINNPEVHNKIITLLMAPKLSNDEAALLARLLIENQRNSLSNLSNQALYAKAKEPLKKEEVSLLKTVFQNIGEYSYEQFGNLAYLGNFLFTVHPKLKDLRYAGRTATVLWGTGAIYYPATALLDYLTRSLTAVKKEADAIISNSVYSKYQTSPQFKITFDRLNTDRKLAISPNPSPNELINHNSTTTSKLITHISESISSSQTTISEKDIAKMIAPLTEVLAGELAELSKEREERLTIHKRREGLKKIEYSYQEIIGAIQVGSFVIDKVFSQPSVAEKFYQAGSAIAHIGFTCASAVYNPIGLLTSAGSLTNSLTQLFNIFKGRLSPHGVLFENIKLIQESLKIIYRDMQAGFEFLAKNQLIIIQKLEQILKQSEISLEEIKSLQEQIDYLTKVILDSVADDHHRRLDKAFEDFISRIRTNTLARDRDINDLNTLVRHATAISRNAVFTTASNLNKIDLKTAIQGQNRLELIFNVIPQLATQLNISIPRINDQVALPNPVEYAKATTLFVMAIIMFPHSNIDNTFEDFIKDHLKSLWETGIELAEFIRCASDKRTVKQVIQKYRECSYALIDKGLNATNNANEIENFIITAKCLQSLIYLNIARQSSVIAHHGFMLHEVGGIFTKSDLELHQAKVNDKNYLKAAIDKTCDYAENITEYIDPNHNLPILEYALLMIASCANSFTSTLRLSIPDLSQEAEELRRLRDLPQVPANSEMTRRYKEIFAHHKGSSYGLPENTIINALLANTETFDLNQIIDPSFKCDGSQIGYLLDLILEMLAINQSISHINIGFKFIDAKDGKVKEPHQIGHLHYEPVIRKKLVNLLSHNKTILTISDNRGDFLTTCPNGGTAVIENYYPWFFQLNGLLTSRANQAYQAQLIQQQHEINFLKKENEALKIKLDALAQTATSSIANVTNPNATNNSQSRQIPDPFSSTPYRSRSTSSTTSTEEPSNVPNYSP